MAKIYIGDTGTALVLDTGTALAGATLLTIEARRPDGTMTSLVGELFEVTKIRFITLSNTFNQAGVWKLQAKVVMPSGTWLGELVSLTIHAAFS